MSLKDRLAAHAGKLDGAAAQLEPCSRCKVPQARQHKDEYADLYCAGCLRARGRDGIAALVETTLTESKDYARCDVPGCRGEVWKYIIIVVRRQECALAICEAHARVRPLSP